MSEQREKLEKLVERIDELLVVLNRVAEDLRQVSTSIKSIEAPQPPKPMITQPKPAPAPVPAAPKIPEKTRVIEDIRAMFPDEVECLLNFEEKEDYVMIKPRQFLGPENFAKIHSIVRGIGGDYVSAKRDSHFRVPKKRT